MQSEQIFKLSLWVQKESLGPQRARFTYGKFKSSNISVGPLYLGAYRSKLTTDLSEIFHLIPKEKPQSVLPPVFYFNSTNSME